MASNEILRPAYLLACRAATLSLLLLLLIRIGSLCYNTLEQPQVGDGVHLLVLNSLSSHDGRGVVNGQQNLKGNFLMLLHHMHDWVELYSPHTSAIAPYSSSR